VNTEARDGTKTPGQWLDSQWNLRCLPKEEPLRITAIFIIGAIIGTTLGFIVYDTVGSAMVTAADFAPQTLSPTAHNAAH
jgi:hypothetical protein